MRLHETTKENTKALEGNLKDSESMESIDARGLGGIGALTKRSGSVPGNLEILRKVDMSAICIFAPSPLSQPRKHAGSARGTAGSREADTVPIFRKHWEASASLIPAQSILLLSMVWIVDLWIWLCAVAVSYVFGVMRKCPADGSQTSAGQLTLSDTSSQGCPPRVPRECSTRSIRTTLSSYQVHNSSYRYIFCNDFLQIKAILVQKLFLHVTCSSYCHTANVG